MANWDLMREALTEIKGGIEKFLSAMPAEGEVGERGPAAEVPATPAGKRPREKKLPHASFTLEELQLISTLKTSSVPQIAEKLGKDVEIVQALFDDYKTAGIPLGKEIKDNSVHKEPPAKRAKTADGDVTKSAKKAEKKVEKKDPSSSLSSPSPSSDSSDSSDEKVTTKNKKKGAAKDSDSDS